MMRRPRTAWLVALWLGAAVPAFAQPPPGAPPPVDWWEHNSRADPDGPAPIKVHVEGTVSAVSASGNTDGETINGGAGLVVRKRPLTSRFSAELVKQDVSYGFGAPTTQFTQRTLREQVDVALSRRVTLVAGVEAYRNTILFINDRLTFYTGAGATLRDNARQKIDVIAGVGHVAFTFDSSAIGRISPLALLAIPTTTPTSSAVLGIESWRFTLPNKMTLMEDASYRKYFDDNLGHLWTFGLHAEHAARPKRCVDRPRLHGEGQESIFPAGCCTSDLGIAC